MTQKPAQGVAVLGEVSGAVLLCALLAAAGRIDTMARFVAGRLSIVTGVLILMAVQAGWP